ncbi:hypothetical protein GCM10009657_27840 [Oryzihumus leptocrescens]
MGPTIASTRGLARCGVPTYLYRDGGPVGLNLGRDRVQRGGCQTTLGVPPPGGTGNRALEQSALVEVHAISPVRETVTDRNSLLRSLVEAVVPPGTVTERGQRLTDEP